MLAHVRRSQDMNVSLNRRNSYPGTCIVCGAQVPIHAGCIVPREAVRVDVPGHGKWLTLCASTLCAEKAIGSAAVVSATVRELRADGSIVMPYDATAVPLLKAIATWDPNARVWQASMLLRDRDVVLAVADKLGLTVDASLREHEDPPRVREAVERARGTARDYQSHGIRWLAYRGVDESTATGVDETGRLVGALLADDMGLGKSMQVLLSLHDDEALLVVCPSNAKAVWPREAARWRPGRFDTVTICDGVDSFKWPSSPRELVVINYDVLPPTPAQTSEEIDKLTAALADLGEPSDDADTPEDPKVTRKRAKVTAQLEAARARKPIGKPPCKTLACADEAHYVENNKAQRTVRWRHISRKCARVYGLTGTPVEYDPKKLFGLLESLRCNPFSWSTFLTQFNGFKGRWGGYDFVRLPAPDGSKRGPVKVEPGTTEILSRVMLRRTKAEVLTELPAKIYSEQPVELSAKIIAELDEITARCIDLLLSGRLPEFGEMAEVRKALAVACIPAMLEIVESYEDAGIPLVVFSAHRAPIEALAKRKGWYAITGDTSAKQRGEIQDAFQAGEGFGVAGTRAMAEAMTLTRASNVLFVDRFWEHKFNKQAEDRCHRLGQRDSVNVVTLVPDHPLTQHVAALLGSKYAFVDAVLHGETSYAAPPSRFTGEDEAAWQARVDAKTEADRERLAAEQAQEGRRRERELAKLAAREVSPKLSEQRAKLRAERTGLNPTTHASVPAPVVQRALAHMLSVCDGARERDDVGFNAPDAAVARWLAPGVMSGLPYALASAVAILRHYPRQLSGEFAELFADA